MKIPAGYKVIIVNPKGTVLQSIDVGEMDLSKSHACAEVTAQIDRAVKYDLWGDCNKKKR